MEDILTEFEELNQRIIKQDSFDRMWDFLSMLYVSAFLLVFVVKACQVLCGQVIVTINLK